MKNEQLLHIWRKISKIDNMTPKIKTMGWKNPVDHLKVVICKDGNLKRR